MVPWRVFVHGCQGVTHPRGFIPTIAANWNERNFFPSGQSARGNNGEWVSPPLAVDFRRVRICKMANSHNPEGTFLDFGRCSTTYLAAADRESRRVSRTALEEAKRGSNFYDMLSSSRAVRRRPLHAIRGWFGGEASLVRWAANPVSLSYITTEI